MGEVELKPCPFCGGKAEMGVLSFEEGTDYQPYCNRHGCWCSLGAYAERQEAIVAWNRRQAQKEQQ